MNERTEGSSLLARQSKQLSLFTSYSKMASILVFFCFHANWPLWPRSRLSILLNFTFESEAIRADLHGSNGIQIHRAPVAQLVGHREVVSSTPAGPTLRVLK